ncbi:DUF4148 domain-containing protein [Ramlibacter alkalitolerans]|uniref:DUF4148 domain-containing protein n=1 Tax=Ramlibacter alkalitolerans TaxID=2039631 RepID=A0ABS1JTH3_9BURK|nr:hypothetical protein [Ramlibacter alkalitolerans]MBL0427512.1 hypothetical protein [Ramlibacter alkalitolerans]
MKRTLSIALLALLAATSVAQAEDGPTRAQSIAEARRNGELLAPGEPGLTERQLHPERYSAAAPAIGRARAEVRAELEQARRNGDLLAGGESGLSAHQLHPSAYPARAVVAGKTREQVRAETLQAIQDGDILAPGEAGVSLRQMHPRSYLARGRGDASQRTAKGLAADGQPN